MRGLPSGAPSGCLARLAELRRSTESPGCYALRKAQQSRAERSWRQAPPGGSAFLSWLLRFIQVAPHRSGLQIELGAEVRTFGCVCTKRCLLDITGSPAKCADATGHRQSLTSELW